MKIQSSSVPVQTNFKDEKSNESSKMRVLTDTLQAFRFRSRTMSSTKMNVAARSTPTLPRLGKQELTMKKGLGSASSKELISLKSGDDESPHGSFEHSKLASASSSHDKIDKMKEQQQQKMKVARSLPKITIKDVFRRNRSQTANPLSASTNQLLKPVASVKKTLAQSGSADFNAQKHAGSADFNIQKQAGIDHQPQPKELKNQHQTHHTIAMSSYEVGHSAPSEKKSNTLESYQILKKVGKGGFATVYLVKQRTSAGRYYALKAIRKSEVVRMKQERQIMNERMILKTIRHVFIVELFETFQDEVNLYMIMEYVAGGDLFRHLRRAGHIPEQAAKFYTGEVLVALEYLHRHNIIYRDLKPENILLDVTGHIKLADFGFAKVILQNTASFCGTPDYIAPEIVIGIPYNHSVDYWSLGVLIFELVSGHTPFGDTTSEKIYNNIECHNVKWHHRIQDDCKALVTLLLQTHATTRLSDPIGIKTHSWYASIDWEKLEQRGIVPPYVPTCESPQQFDESIRELGARTDYELRSNLQLTAPLTVKQQDYMNRCFTGY